MTTQQESGDPHLLVGLPHDLPWTSRRASDWGGSGVIYEGRPRNAITPLAYVFVLNALSNPHEPLIEDTWTSAPTDVVAYIEANVKLQNQDRGRPVKWISSGFGVRQGGFRCLEISWFTQEGDSEWFNQTFRCNLNGSKTIFGISYDVKGCEQEEPRLLKCRKRLDFESQFIGSEGVGPGLRCNPHPKGDQYVHIASL